MRILDQPTVSANLATCFALALHQTGGSTSMRVDILQRFADADALLMPVLADDAVNPDALPDWVPLPNKGEPFIPRGFIICLILNAKSYEAACNGAPLSDLNPWREGDGAAYALINNVISVQRNGVAKLVVALGERAAAHASFPVLREVMWYTLTAKGVALSDYFQARANGRFLERTFANGKSKKMPIYTLAAADWQNHVSGVIEKLLGIEDHFSFELASVYKNVK